MNIETEIDKDKSLDLLNEILHRARPARFSGVDRPLTLYGAGDFGRMARDYCRKIGIDVDFVVDANARALQDSNVWEGERIFLPEEVPVDRKRNDLLAVCIATIPYTTIAESLKAQGWRHLVPFYDLAETYRDRHPLSNGWLVDKLEHNDLLKLKDVLCSWSDEISRAHHLQFIAWRLLREDWFFLRAPVSCDNRFFIPEVLQEMSKPVSFADVGAHHGKVSLRLFDLIGNELEKVWLIEPDTENLVQLRHTVDNAPTGFSKKAEIFANAVGNKSETRQFFEGLGYASQVSGLGNREITLTTIDELGISPTFLKLHLEGGELAALEGAKETIRSKRPILAVTSYHTADGLWRLPRWLMTELPDYRISMRLHSWCGTGAVIYAFPNV